MKVLSIVALSGKWHRPVTSFITRMRSFPFKSKHSWHKFFAQTWNNFMHYFANCSLTNIVCVCKGLMGGPARACTNFSNKFRDRCVKIKIAQIEK